MKLITTVSYLYYVFWLLALCNAKSYRDHSLVYAMPKDKPGLEFFKKFASYYNVNFWRKPSFVNQSVEFSIRRSDLAELIRDTREMDMEFYTIIRNLQSAFENQTVRRYVRRKWDSFDWQNYYKLEDIYNWLRDLCQLHPQHVKLETIGKSVENRNILAVKITLEKQRNRPKVLVEGGAHAREWISPSFVTYMINLILSAKTTTDKEVKTVAYAYDWLFVPLLNPDGYEFTHTDDRLWRKNRRGSYGVDLNRNFGIAFGSHGASSYKRDEDYCGPSAFSEPETSALSSFIRDNCQNLMYYLAIHSYGQYVIIPYGSMTEHMDNYQTVKRIADHAASRAMKKYGISYSVGTAHETVGYFGSGISTDWVKKSFNVPYAVTIELPDKGQTGFALPPSKILETCEATMCMLLDYLGTGKDTENFERQLSKSNAAEQVNPGSRALLIFSATLSILRFL